MMVPLAAAAPFLPPLPETDPNEPGPFAFADAGRIRAILQSAGFADLAIEPFDGPIGGLTLDDAHILALRVRTARPGAAGTPRPARRGRHRRAPRPGRP